MRWFLILAIAAFSITMVLFISFREDMLGPDVDSFEIQEVPMMVEELVNAEIASAQSTGTMLSWIVIGFAIVMQAIAWVAAARKIGTVKKTGSSIAERFSHLEAIEVYFDLPLYLGLLGTVMSFILITVYPEAGLMFAYVSTGIGIVVSVILHLFYLTPYKQELIARREGMEA